MSEATLFNLLAALDTAVLERRADSSFTVLGQSPDWFRRLYSDAVSRCDGFRPGEHSPFLENFVLEAEEFWHRQDAGRLKSGVWIELDSSGQEHHLEATAMRVGSSSVLLIESLGATYDETQAIFQKARENLLAHERLTKEIQKKEILLHCIVHDLSGPLTGINALCSYINPAKLTAQEKQFLDIGQRSASRLEKMIQEILDAFSAEIASLEAFESDPAQAPDAALCARSVVQALQPAFAVKQTTLQLDPSLDLTADWKVIGERSRLERVFSNLTENALRHSPAGSTVTVNLSAEGDQILMTIDDEGPGIPPEIAKTLFQKFAQGKKNTGKAGLGLYFCRMTVEHWGGAIGYAVRPQGGSRFWFRLRRPIAQ